jgi:hypothetical protein
MSEWFLSLYVSAAGFLVGALASLGAMAVYYAAT